MTRAIVLSVGVLVLAGCRPSGGQCVPGRVEACTCSTGAAGSQSCNAAGDGFGECTCTAITCATGGAARCGAHGSCADSATGPTCTCATGYAGADCAACARDFQDRDGDGTCTAACGSGGSTCGTHGRCDDTSGTATCACEPGYTGIGCDACATGWQDTDGDGVCRPACATAMLGCGLGGTCDDGSGTPTCRCASNTSGATCASCAAGFQDNDGNNTCEPACTAALCGSHGTCSDTAGRASCTCASGYTGPDCRACASGFQDRDADGTCAPDCATAGLTCAGRETCDDTIGTARCVCIAGFSAGTLADGGVGCLYTGGPQDPGFQGVPANAWSTPDGGWTFDQDAGGLPSALSDDAGIATLTVAGHITSSAPLQQRFVLAGPELAEGLRAKLLVRAATTSFGDAPLMLHLNDTVTRLPAPTTAVTTLSTCVGAGALGAQTDFSLTGAPTYGSGVSSSVLFDRVWFEPDATCPAPGRPLNGDFAAPGTGGWRLLGPQVAVTPSGRINGSPALRVALAQRCDGATAQGGVSVPLRGQLPRAALRFKALGTTGSRMSLTFDGFPTVLRGTGVVETYTWCLEDALRGRSLDLSMTLFSGSGFCSDVLNEGFDFDDFELVSEPSCPVALPVGDGTFEYGALLPGWYTRNGCDYLPCGQSEARVANGAALARTGLGALELSQQQRCGSTTASTRVLVPPSNAGGGPAVRFFYRLPVLTGLASVRIEDRLSVTLPVASAWTPQIICLNPSGPGRVANIQFSMNGGSGLCSDVYATPDVLSIDDFAVTTDIACPP